jgi:hypothetical protein
MSREATDKRYHVLTEELTDTRALILGFLAQFPIPITPLPGTWPGSLELSAVCKRGGHRTVAARRDGGHPHPHPGQMSTCSAST